MKIGRWARRRVGRKAHARNDEAYLFRFRAAVVLNVLGTVLSGYCAFAIDTHEPLGISAIEILIGLIYSATLFYLLISHELSTAAIISLSMTVIGILWAAAEAGVFILLWLYAVPLLSFLLMGLHAGLIFNTALLLTAAAFLVAGDDLAEHVGVYILLGYAAVTVLAGLSEIRYRRRVRALEQLSVTDALTGVFNRRKFQELIESEIQRAQRYGAGPAIVMFDIDRYKLINDYFGHQVGDEVLRHVAQVVQANVRRTDALVRLGGDEFLILAPEISTALALRMAEKLRLVVKQGRLRDLPVTISIGVAQWRRGEDAGALLGRADRALYRAKSGGRDRVAYDSPPPVAEARLVSLQRDADAPAIQDWPPPAVHYHTRSLR